MKAVTDNISPLMSSAIKRKQEYEKSLSKQGYVLATDESRNASMTSKLSKYGVITKQP